MCRMSGMLHLVIFLAVVLPRSATSQSFSPVCGGPLTDSSFSTESPVLGKLAFNPALPRGGHYMPANTAGGEIRVLLVFMRYPG